MASRFQTTATLARRAGRAGAGFSSLPQGAGVAGGGLFSREAGAVFHGSSLFFWAIGEMATDSNTACGHFPGV